MRTFSPCRAALRTLGISAIRCLHCVRRIAHFCSKILLDRRIDRRKIPSDTKLSIFRQDQLSSGGSYFSAVFGVVDASFSKRGSFRSGSTILAIRLFGAALLLQANLLQWRYEARLGASCIPHGVDFQFWQLGSVLVNRPFEKGSRYASLRNADCASPACKLASHLGAKANRP